MKLHHHLIIQTIDALIEIFSQKKHADKVIEKFMKSNKKWGSRDRKFFAETVYEMVRWWRLHWSQAGLPADQYLNPEMMTDANVCKVWAAYWVNRGQELPDWEELDGFEFKSSKKFSVDIQQSVPEWLHQLGEEQFGHDWKAILHALNQPAKVYLRTNQLKIQREPLLTQLMTEDIQGKALPGQEDAIELMERKNVFTNQSFKKGLFEVQDAASQMVAPLLDVQPGHRVVDACAGAGGKSLHLASLMKNKGKILALDIHEWKLKELKTRAARNGVDIIETRFIDSTKVIKRMEASCDRLLLDVPCSGLGVLRRNPDTKWKLSMEEINRLVQLQKEILWGYSKMVKKGGKMVYATCSILPIENQNQVQAFLQAHPEWKLEQELILRPDHEGFDGFYAARLSLQGA